MRAASKPILLPVPGAIDVDTSTQEAGREARAAGPALPAKNGSVSRISISCCTNRHARFSNRPAAGFAESES